PAAAGEVFPQKFLPSVPNLILRVRREVVDSVFVAVIFVDVDTTKSVEVIPETAFFQGAFGFPVARIDCTHANRARSSTVSKFHSRRRERRQLAQPPTHPHRLTRQNGRAGGVGIPYLCR